MRGVIEFIAVVYLLIDSQMWLDSFLHTLNTLSYYYTPDLSPAHAHLYHYIHSNVHTLQLLTTPPAHLFAKSIIRIH